MDLEEEAGSIWEDLANLSEGDTVAMKDNKVKLRLSRKANPIRCPARRIPYILQELGKREIQRLVEREILESVNITEKSNANMRKVLQRLQETCVNVWRFLGNVLEGGVCRADEKEVKDLVYASSPVDKQELKTFLGAVSFHEKFIPQLRSKCADLYKLLRKDQRWIRNQSLKSCFNAT
ncbi:hypothetical protein ACOME3_006520 [Neoechinorhynchus agilis]